MSLQATALGLHTHGIGGFDRDEARSSFNIPADFEIGACWAICYLGDFDTLSEGLRAREIATRTRKYPVDFVISTWDVAAML